jgi:uncharacterized protein (DUF1330 family)
MEMKTMKTVKMDQTTLPAILPKIPTGTPITMVNFLKYKGNAEYPDGFEATPCSGRDGYNRRYIPHTKKRIEEVGGTVVFEGPVCAGLIGPPEESWDSVLIVTYPSIEVFMEMVSAPEHMVMRVHREAALEDSRLIVATAGALEDI